MEFFAKIVYDIMEFGEAKLQLVLYFPLLSKYVTVQSQQYKH